MTSAASPELVAFGGGAYRRRSEHTSGLLGQLFERLRTEGFAVSYTMEDFRRDCIMEHFPHLTLDEQREVLALLSPDQLRALLQSLPAEELLAVLSAEQIQQLRDQLATGGPAKPRKPRRKK